MKKIVLLLLVFISKNSAEAQYKNDNVLYKNVYISTLCDSLARYPERIILDVRSPEEYNDQQMKGMSGMNLGRLRNTINISVNELPKRLDELQQYKEKPVFVVCSHSQRSRRASTLLAKNGFQNILNINGGMSSIRQLSKSNNECIFNQLITNIKYDLISSIDLCERLTNDKNAYILDVRSENVFKHISASAMDNSIGILKGSHHIAIEDVSYKLSTIPVDKNIIVVDEYGADAEDVATLLKNNNYKNVSVLGGGIEQLLITDEQIVSCRKDIYQPAVSFKIIGAADLNNKYSTLKDPVFLDIRSEEEFSNTHKDKSKNIGHFKNAINIPYNELFSKMVNLFPYKQSPVIIYSFNMDVKCFDAAKLLTSQGFTNIYVLIRGMFNARWTEHNFKEYSNLSKLFVDIPDENL